MEICPPLPLGIVKYVENSLQPKECSDRAGRKKEWTGDPETVVPDDVVRGKGE